MPGRKPNKDGSLSDDIGYIVGIAVLVIALVNMGIGSAVKMTIEIIDKGKLKTSFVDYAQFIQYYLSTFLLSLTLTVTISVFAISRIYGYNIHCTMPIFIVILRSFLTGLSISILALTLKLVHCNLFNLLIFWFVYAMLKFAIYYNASFLAGTVAGVSGGLTLIAIAHNHRTPSWFSRRSLPWAGWVTVLKPSLRGYSLLHQFLRGVLGLSVRGVVTASISSRSVMFSETLS